MLVSVIVEGSGLDGQDSKDGLVSKPKKQKARVDDMNMYPTLGAVDPNLLMMPGKDGTNQQQATSYFMTQNGQYVPVSPHALTLYQQQLRAAGYSTANTGYSMPGYGQYYAVHPGSSNVGYAYVFNPNQAQQQQQQQQPQGVAQNPAISSSGVQGMQQQQLQGMQSGVMTPTAQQSATAAAVNAAVNAANALKNEDNTGGSSNDSKGDSDDGTDNEDDEDKRRKKKDGDKDKKKDKDGKKDKNKKK